MKQFLSIREFSEFSGVSIPSLRHWDSIGLLLPRKQDPETNYRYYTPDQIISTKFIILMRSLGVPLKVINNILEERTPAKVARLLEQQRKNLDIEMHRLQECYSIIDTRLELIHNGMYLEEGFHAIDGFRVDKGSPTHGSTWVEEGGVHVLYHEEAPYILGPEHKWHEGKTGHDAFAEFCGHVQRLRINLNFPIGAYYENMEAFSKAPRQHKHFISMDPTGNETKPSGEYLTAFSRGDFDEYRGLVKKMNDYLEEHALEPIGPVFTTYLHDEICVKSPAEYLIETSVAVKKKRR